MMPLTGPRRPPKDRSHRSGKNLIKPMQDESRGFLYPYRERPIILHPGLGDE